MGDVSGELFTMLVEEGVGIYSGSVVQLFSTVRTTQIKYTNTKAVSTRENTKKQIRRHKHRWTISPAELERKQQKTR